ncbi:hypothetical protein [Enterococcus gilvus]|uniref:hypothetical protein n=1 Tax=Enterococcus gilvus TaxID=160453 RepID=UPI002914D192|nr:hypothetical protein [Enterococcus gilvus]MDU5511053.1 hypothetical protein [Enterococcus gilvus]
MKVYTIQKREFLTNVDAEGFVLPTRDVEYSIFSDDENTLWALKWMEEQFCRRIDFPLDRELIWLWPDIYHYL